MLPPAGWSACIRNQATKGHVFCLCFVSQLICSYVFMPVAFMMGVPYEDSFVVAELLGVKLFINEFVAYEKLSELKNNRIEGLDKVIEGQTKWISVSDV